MNHEEKVDRIAAALKSRDPSQGPASLKKAGVSHMVPNPNDPKHKDRKVDVSDLKDVLEIDVKNRTCTAEPGVPFSELVPMTLKHGLAPMLVPELKTITLGGAVSGCSVESMSYKYGGFHDSCLEYEVITASGEVMVCTPRKNADVFHMIHGSYGTLGVISKIKFKLIPAKPFVRMEYVTYPSFKALQDAILIRARANDVDFIDAIVHAPDCCVLCLGTMVETAPYASDYTFLNVFYKSTRERKEDYLTLFDYYFRYDTECHWISRSLPVPGMETKLMRLLFGKTLLSSTNLLTWSKRLSPVLKFDKRPDVVVDVFIPVNRLARFWKEYRETIGYYPVWVVPYKRVQRYPWVNDDFEAKIDDDFFFDIAVYGMKNREKDVNYYEVIEDLTYRNNGIKTLISHNFYDRERFWKIYNRKNFESVKKRTDPRNAFRDLYDKFHFR